jgi:aryl-alcohol dehydrogenase-like predicted oxidoreductase
MKGWEMHYVRIPGTDLVPSRICLGTNRFGTLIDQQSAFSLLDAYVDMEGTFIDTAHVYADWIPGAPKSASENTIGRWLRTSGKRDKIVLATKGGHPDLSTLDISRLSRGEITSDVHDSLRYLQTDHLDLYWLHRDDPARPVAEMLETLNEMVKAGKIRHFGCSNWRVSRIQEAMDYSDGHGIKGFVASQLLWSLAVPNREALSDPEHLAVFDQTSLDFHKKTGLAVIPYSSQGQGFFSKLDTVGVSGLKESDRRAYYNDTNVGRFPRIRDLAVKYAVSIAEIVLSYLISQPFPTVPIVGCRTIAQLTESIRAAELRLEPQDLSYLEGA